MDKPRLKSERTEISLIEFSDVENIVDFYRENENHLERWDPKKPEGFFTKEYWSKRVLSAQNEWLEKTSLRLVIKLLESQKIIGFMTFSSIERGPFEACRLGYKIHHEIEGKGYMSESLRVAIRFIFEELNLHRIEANYIADNKRSGKLLERLGFVKEGIAKKYLLINGTWQDHILTSLTNHNWSNK